MVKVVKLTCYKRPLPNTAGIATCEGPVTCSIEDDSGSESSEAETEDSLKNGSLSHIQFEIPS